VIHLGKNSAGQRVFVKKAPCAADELLVISEVSRYFLPGSIQQLLAVDRSGQQLFFKKFEGKMLNTVRLEHYHGTSFLNHTGPMEAVDWFVGIELQRAEQVGDTYCRTMHPQLTTWPKPLTPGCNIVAVCYCLTALLKTMELFPRRPPIADIRMQ
jgi:hypothetical protein